jgi:hypothetical protein
LGGLLIGLTSTAGLILLNGISQARLAVNPKTAA